MSSSAVSKMVLNSTKGPEMSLVLHPVYYFSAFWLEHSDPDVATFSGMSVGLPWSWMFLACLMAYFLRIWGPNMMAARKAHELRPWMIFFNSFAFGGYVVALGCGFYMSHFFQDAFDCSAYQPWKRDHFSMSVRFLAYALVYGKIYDFIKPVISVLSKKRDISHLHLLNIMFMVVGASVVVKINPGGIFAFFAIMDCLYQMVVYSYLTFAAASAEFHPSRTWKMCILMARMLTMSLTLAHGSHFLSIPNCGHPTLKLGVVVYSTLTLVLYPYDWYMTEAKVKETNRPRRFSIAPNQTVYQESKN